MNNDPRCTATATRGPEPPNPGKERRGPLFPSWYGRTANPRLSVTEMPDNVLLSGFHARDPLLALQFVRRFQNPVYGVAISVVSDAALAQDIAQTAFEQAWRRAESYDSRRGSVRTWLLRITHNLAVDAVRIRRPVPIDPDEVNLLVTTMVRSPEHQVLANESSMRLRTALAQLPSAQARAVVMAAAHGMTAQEIADFEHIPLGTAKSRIRSGLTKLHTVLPRPGDDHD
jgi:RNA polymerase sigma factor (sigma-70 family)